MSTKKEKQSGLEWLRRDVFVLPYCYALCLSERNFHRELKRLKVDKKQWPPFLTTTHADATTHFFAKLGNRDQCVIVTIGNQRRKVEAEQVYAMLVHEAVHIWQASKDYMGERYPGAECEAYFIQGIAQELMVSYKKLVKHER